MDELQELNIEFDEGAKVEIDEDNWIFRIVSEDLDTVITVYKLLKVNDREVRNKYYVEEIYGSVPEFGGTIIDEDGLIEMEKMYSGNIDDANENHNEFCDFELL